MPTQPTTPKHMHSPNSTLEWTTTPTDGYKASTKYPGYYWKKKETATPTPQPSPVKATIPEPSTPTLPYAVQFYAEEATIMAQELSTSQGVVLAANPRNPEGVNKIRVSENPWWYREGYKQGYTSRQSTLSALKQIANRQINTSHKYCAHLVSIIEDRLTELAKTFPEFASQLYATPTSGD